MRRIAAVLLTSLLLTADAARADDLADAWRAHEELDFEAAERKAEALIASGEGSPHQLASAYLLLGRCHATRREEALATEDFTRALGLEAELRLPQGSSPIEASPFMEARGFWLDYPTRLDLDAELAADSWDVHVTDPVGLGGRVRILGDGGETLDERDAGHDVTVRISRTVAARSVALVDGYGNRLLQLVLPQPPPVPVALTAAPVQPVASAPSGGRAAALSRKQVRLRRTGLAQIGAGIGIAALGIPFNQSRERMVDRWNGSGCELADGTTRQAQCGHLPPRIETAERTAISLYSLGGAVLTSGLVMWGVAKRRASADRRLSCAPTGLGALCRGSF